MSDILDEKIEITPQEAMDFTAEFKGQELAPFGEGRRSVAFSIGVRMSAEPKPTVTDMHAIIFICLASKSDLAKAHRNPDGFWEKILVWADANVSPADYENEGFIVRKILEAAYATKVEEIRDPSSAGSGLGN